LTYHEVVKCYEDKGYKLLDASNGLNWVYMYKVEQAREKVYLMAWYNCSPEEVNHISLDSYHLIEILENLHYKISM
jgi:hypothetical protein